MSGQELVYLTKVWRYNRNLGINSKNRKENCWRERLLDKEREWEKIQRDVQEMLEGGIEEAVEKRQMIHAGKMRMRWKDRKSMKRETEKEK